MSGRRNLKKNSTRVLSDSENEDESSHSESIVRKTRTSNSFHSNSAQTVAFAESTATRNENSISSISNTRNSQKNSARILSSSDSDEETSYSLNPVRTTRASNALNSNSSQRGSFVNSTSTPFNHVNSNHIFSTSSVVKSVLSDSDYIYNTNSALDNSVFTQRSFSNNSSHVDVSTVHQTMLQKLRWVCWRYIYLKVISCINFDVWLLSRLRGSKKALILLLLPLLLYLLCSAISSTDEVPLYDITKSSLSSFASSLFSLLSSPFTYLSTLFKEDGMGFNINFLLPSFSTLSGYLSSLFVKTEEKTYIVQTTSTISKDSSPVSYVQSLSREEVESVAVKVLEERLNDMVKKIQVSNTRDLMDVKDGTSAMQEEISDLRNEFKSLSTLLQQFQNDVQKSEKSSTKDIESLSAEHKVDINLLNTKIKAFEEKLASLGNVKKCCDEKMAPAEIIASIEKHLVAAFQSVMVDDKSSSYHFFRHWLDTKFTDPRALSSEINLALENLKKDTQTHSTKQDLKVIESVVHHYFESLKADSTFTSHHEGFSAGSLSSEDVRKIVREAIMLYDADKTGKVDYALESAGGSVLSIRCSESYTEKKGRLSLFGVPLWSDHNTPRTAIQPDVKPGQCWSFKGSQGFLVIELSYTIRPSGFTMEHIPRSLSPTGSIDSAPRDFSVWGLASETDTDGTLLGEFTYNDKGEPLQYFPVQIFSTEPFSYVELKIHSNHGNLEYTCLYRFRVHGTRAK